VLGVVFDWGGLGWGGGGGGGESNCVLQVNSALCVPTS